MADRSAETISARIGHCAETVRTVIKRIRQAWGDSPIYRPSDHYMRGPGPKWREKHGQDRTASGFVQQPVMLSDKWDF
jgi:hypothetical protein